MLSDATIGKDKGVYCKWIFLVAERTIRRSKIGEKIRLDELCDLLGNNFLGSRNFEG